MTIPVGDDAVYNPPPQPAPNDARDNHARRLGALERVLGPSEFFQSLTIDTTPDFAAGLNTVASGGYELVRGASSIEFKVDVQDIDLQDLDQIHWRMWRDAGRVERDPDTDRWGFGAIAQELHQIESLRPFVKYDDAGEPEAVFTEALLVAVIASQEKRLAALEARLNALETP